MKKLLKFLEFEEEMAEKIRNNPTHERHTEQWNERYWHGYAAAMRRATQRITDEILIGEKPKKKEKNTMDSLISSKKEGVSEGKQNVTQ